MPGRSVPWWVWAAAAAGFLALTVTRAGGGLAPWMIGLMACLLALSATLTREMLTLMAEEEDEFLSGFDARPLPPRSPDSARDGEEV